MLDADALPNPADDELWRRYLETCCHLGVKPTPRERAQELIADRARVIADSGILPVKH